MIALKTKKKNHNGQSKRGKYGKGHGQEEFKVKLSKFPEARENAREQVAIRGLSESSGANHRAKENIDKAETKILKSFR